MVATYLASPTSGNTHLLDHAVPTLRVVDHDIAGTELPAGHAKLSTPPTVELTAELDGAALWLELPPAEILLAALARTIARTVGDGVASVDVADEHGGVLRCVPLICATAKQATATEVVRSVHQSLAALAALADHPSGVPSEVLFNYEGMVPEEAMHEPPAPGQALELRAYRTAGLVHLDWWYEPRRFDAYTVQELTEQFTLSLYEMTSDALAPI